LEYANRGETAEALSSMVVDLANHPETKDIEIGFLGTMLAMSGQLDTPGELREFIEGIQ
jgi:hypothetical protein